jgi:hypothetical protein
LNLHEEHTPFQNGTNTIGHYTLHQAKGDASLGNRKSGYLNKRSEGRLRNVWQKRRCQVRPDGYLEIFHGDETKPPTQVRLGRFNVETTSANLVLVSFR